MGKTKETLPCLLPPFVFEKSLCEVLRLEWDTATEAEETLRIGETALPLPQDDKLSVYMDWSRVVYFDDTALLQLVLVQHRLMQLGVEITHFTNAGNARAKPRNTNAEVLDCEKHVLRQLGAIGYLRHWLTDSFGANSREIHRLSMVNPLQGVEPLARQHEIMPITSCQSLNGLMPGSPEDETIRRYEEAVGADVFAEQDSPSMRRLYLIASGEFGQLVVRQCRKNVVEHAKPCDLALSIARIVRRRDILSDWGLTFEDLRLHVNSPLTRLLASVDDDTPVLDMTVIDNGCGIPSSIGETWHAHAMKDSRAKRRVDGVITSEWEHDHKLLEFALDKDVSSKSAALRSLEDSGLGRISEMAAQHGGALEVTSARYRVTHEQKNCPAPATITRSLAKGTTIRVLLPLREAIAGHTAFWSFPRPNSTTTVAGSSIDSTMSMSLCQHVSLRELWIKTTNGLVDVHSQAEHNGSGQQVPHVDEAGSPQDRISILERTQRLVVELRAHIANSKGNAKVAVLDWSELPWDEHIASPFLLQLKQDVVDKGSLELPVVHINVPQGLLRLSKLAVLAYSGSEPLPTCVFFEGGTKYFWLGLALANPASAAHTRETASGLDIRVLEQRMVTVFNDILHGVRARNTLRSIASQSDRALILKHIRKTGLFTEEYIEDKSDRLHVPSGHFLSRGA